MYRIMHHLQTAPKVLQMHMRNCTRTFAVRRESSQNTQEGESNHPLSEALNEARTHEPEVSENIGELFPSDVEDRLKAYRKHKQDQAQHAFRPKVDPELTSIILFPGQGSQFVGMGKELLNYPNVREMFDAANSLLGYNLLDICLYGPKEKLDSTLYCQPAMYVTCLAAAERLKDDYPKAIENCVATAGFSVGEYAALVFAGALSFEQGLRVVQTRAKLMQEASEQIDSGMMSVFINSKSRLGLACQAAEEYCKVKYGIEQPVCRVANYLSPECKVIAGNSEAIDFIDQHKEEFNIRRVRRLPVSGGFHTKLMYEVVSPLRQALSHCKFKPPLISVHNNVTGKRYLTPESIANLLVQQVFSPVKWEQILHILYSREQGVKFPKTYEVGPGSQMGSLLRSVNLRAKAFYTKVDV